MHLVANQPTSFLTFLSFITSIHFFLSPPTVLVQATILSFQVYGFIVGFWTEFCPSPICLHYDARAYTLKHKSGHKNPLVEILCCLPIAFVQKDKFLSKMCMIFPSRTTAHLSSFIFSHSLSSISCSLQFYNKVTFYPTSRLEYTSCPVSCLLHLVSCWALLRGTMSSKEPSLAAPQPLVFPSESCNYLLFLSEPLAYCITIICLHCHIHN